MKVTVYLVHLENLQRFGKWAGRVGNQRMSQNPPNYSIVKIGLNTEKSLGELRRLAVLLRCQ